MKYSYYMDVLSPLHIGNGAKLEPLEYVVLPERKKFYRLDMNKLFASPSFNLESFVRGSKNRNFSAATMIGRNINIEEFAVYSLSIPDAEARLLERNKGQVQEMIKECGRPYLPGSSLKGALRTSLLASFLAADSFRNEYEEEIYNSLQETVRLRREERNKTKTFFSYEAESSLLGGTNYCLMRALQVSDSSTVNSNEMAVYAIKVVSKRDGYAWKILGRAWHNRQPDQPLLLSSKPDPGHPSSSTSKLTNICFRMKLTVFWFYEEKFIADLAGCCRRACEEFLRNEALFYRNLGLQPLVLAFDQLLTYSQGLMPNQFFCQLSWGTGYGAKGVGKVINRELFASVRDAFRMGYRDQDFPKTRKIIFQDGGPLTVPGWVKVTLEGE